MQGQATIARSSPHDFAALLIGDGTGCRFTTSAAGCAALRNSSTCSIPSGVRDRADAVDPGRMRGLIEFNDVSFSYDGKRPAIADLSFTALPGETIAMVGSTGAGKSTALALLHRAFDPQSGVIKIDGMDIKAVKLAALRHNIGVVYQEALLFNRSIAENLRVGNPDATDEQLLEAAARAQASEMIARHPDGLDGTVGERGRSLSGGERQRISIARAL